MSRKASDELRERIKRSANAVKSLAAPYELMRQVDLLLEIVALCEDSICPPDTIKGLTAAVVSMELVIGRLQKLELSSKRGKRMLTVEQVKAQLLSAKDQAGTNMPSIVPCLDKLIDDAEKINGETDPSRKISFVKAAEQWIQFVLKFSGDREFEDDIQGMRKIINGNADRSERDSAFIAYSTMCAVDFASLLCSIIGGMQFLAEHDPASPEAMAISKGVFSALVAKSQSANQFLIGLGINSPQHALAQLEWLEGVVEQSSKDAGIPLGKVKSLHGGIIWERNDDG